MNLRKLTRFRLRTLLVVVTVVCALLSWFWARPREFAREQTLAGRRMIHDRDRIYLDFVFDQTVKDHLVTVIGDSRLTHWDSVQWIACPNREVIVSYASDHALLVWDRHDGSIHHGFYDVVASAYAPGAERFFMLTHDAKLRTWSMDEKPVIEEQLDIPRCEYFRMGCSHDGRFLVCSGKSSGGFFETLWDRETSRSVFTVKERFTAATFSPDSKTLLLVKDDTINEYDTGSGRLMTQETIPPDEDGGGASVYVAVFSRDGEHLYVADALGRIFVFRWEDRQIVRELEGGLETIRDMAVSDEETDIVVATDRVRHLFTLGNPDRIKTAVLLNEPASAVYGGPNGTVASVKNGRLVEMNGKFPRRMVGGPRVDATCFAFSARGDRIALAGRDGQIVIRETAKWKRVQSWRAHDAWIRQLVWSPRGNPLVSTADDRVIAAWDPETGDEIHSLSAASGVRQRTVAFDTDGKYIARYRGARDASIGILDATTFDLVSTIPRKSLYVRGDFLFSGDGRRFYVGSSTVMVNVWSLDDDKLVRSFGARTVDEVKLALTNEEDVILAADARNVSAFDIATGSPLWSIPVHDSLISDISSHPSQPLLATSGNDGMVVLVDTDKGRVLKRLRLGPTRGDILQVEFSPNGQLLAAAMSNGAVVVMRSPWD
jgi:WD40 repeat protein